MKSAKVIFLNYEESDNISCQGTRDYIQRYLDNGYYIKEARNGFWVLVKPAGVKALLENEDGKRGYFNIKQDILAYYGKTKISPNLADKFNKACEDKKIKVFFEGNNYSFV